MTLITLTQECADRLELGVNISSVINTSDSNIKLLKTMIEQTVQSIKDEHEWPELQQEFTFTLSTNVDSYALPGDFDRFLIATWWNRTQKWPLIGPIDPQMWQLYKSGLVTTLPRQRFRLKSWGQKQFFIDPTPTSTENSQTCAFEYLTNNGIRPKTWAVSTSWNGLRYCSYNGYIFDRGTTAAATTGTNAPTPASLNDGLITWSVLSGSYNKFLDDTDEVILNSEIVRDEAVWRYKRERKLDYEALKNESDKRKEIAMTKLETANIISVRSSEIFTPKIGPWSYPEGGFGI